MATVEHTDAELRAAFAGMRKRPPNWPDTFEATVADPVRRRMLGIGAAVIAHAPVARSAPTAPVPPQRPGLARPLPPTRPPGYVDHKRAAAGDRDD